MSVRKCISNVGLLLEHAQWAEPGTMKVIRLLQEPLKDLCQCMPSANLAMNPAPAKQLQVDRVLGLCAILMIAD